MGLWPLDEKIGIKGNAAIRIGIKLYHPAVDAFGIELIIDGAIQRVGKVDPPPVAADLHHLRTAVQSTRANFGMRLAGPDAADPDGASQLGCERVGHVVLAQVAGTPAGHVEKAIVHGKVDIGHERRDC